jgi:hypothetical protein
LSWLRASRKVVDPQGVAWDIYVTRARFGTWKAIDSGVDDELAGRPGAALWFVMVPVMVVGELVLALVRLVLLVPTTIGRAVTRQGLRIEAVADWPEPQRYGWEVTVEARERVLAEIADGLERGSIAQPAGAVFLGELE